MGTHKLKLLVVGALVSGCTQPVYYPSEDCEYAYRIPCESDEEEVQSAENQLGKVLYLAQTGRVTSALKLYKKYWEENGSHDFLTLQKIALILIEEGASQYDDESALLSTFGAGISMHESCLPILESTLSHTNPQIQLAALNFLASFHDAHCDEMITKAMASNYLAIRFEAAFLLAQSHHPDAIPQIEALMAKVPPQAKQIFPALIAMNSSQKATALMKRQLNDISMPVRIAAINEAARYGRDDLLPLIRTLATQTHPQQQEACAVALGALHDSASREILQKFSQSKQVELRLAAHHALCKLGAQESKEVIESLALDGNTLAITLLGQAPGSEEVLAELLSHDNIQVSVNAGMALLERQDRRCLAPLKKLLVKDSKDLGLSRIASPSGALGAWKVTASTTELAEDNPYAYEFSTFSCEMILQKMTHVLPEEEILALAEEIFQAKETDLIPAVVNQLMQLQTYEGIEVLKTYEQQLGAPLTRHYCNLALYKLGEDGPHGSKLVQWIQEQKNTNLIRFRTYLPWNVRNEASSYQLTAEQQPRLLIEAFQALAQAQNDQAIEALIDAIQDGNSKNRYALAGLLIRATL
jgi:HEAT repeat protein